MRLIKILMALLLFAGCTTSNKENVDDNNTGGQVPPNGDFVVIGDSVEMPAFEVQIELTQRANKKIDELKETIIVSAFFSGIPIDKTIPEYAESREFMVKDYRIILKNDKRIASFKAVKIHKDVFDALEDKNIEVLINIYSGRTSTNVNLLECEILQGMINDIKGKRHILKGELIE